MCMASFSSTVQVVQARACELQSLAQNRQHHSSMFMLVRFWSPEGIVRLPSTIRVSRLFNQVLHMVMAASQVRLASLLRRVSSPPSRLCNRQFMAILCKDKMSSRLFMQTCRKFMLNPAPRAVSPMSTLPRPWMALPKSINSTTSLFREKTRCFWMRISRLWISPVALFTTWLIVVSTCLVSPSTLHEWLTDLVI